MATDDSIAISDTELSRMVAEVATSTNAALKAPWFRSRYRRQHKKIAVASASYYIAFAASFACLVVSEHYSFKTREAHFWDTASDWARYAAYFLLCVTAYLSLLNMIKRKRFIRGKRSSSRRSQLQA